MSHCRLALLAFALVLLLTPIAATAQQPSQPPPQEQVGGRVVSQTDKHPIPHAKITLTNTRDQKIAATAIADDEGRFRFDPVPPGKYRMNGSATNYLPANYQQHGQYATAIVTGAGLATDSLELQLNPISSISGHVFDNGEPVQRASVMLFREDPSSAAHVTQSQTSQTNDDGAYEFNRVAPGRYFLVANGTPWYAVHPPLDRPGFQTQFRVAVDPALDVAYPPVYYPDSLEPSGATPITLHGGETPTADLQMHPEHAVTLTLQLPLGDAGNNYPTPQLFRTIFGTEESALTQSESFNSNGTTTTTIFGIAPGQYSLRNFTSTGLFGPSRRVDLTSSITTADAADPPGAASLTVTAHAANGASLPTQLQVSLRSLPSNQSMNAKLNEKGVAEFPTVPTGDYRVAFLGSPRAIYILTLAVEGKPVADKQLHITNASHLTVEMTLVQGTFQVEGYVRREGQPVPGVFVALVPADADTDLFRRYQTDLDGSFTFNNVVPGNYIVIALDDPAEDLRWTDIPTIMKYLQHGTPLSVPANGSSPVRLADPISAQPR